MSSAQIGRSGEQLAEIFFQSISWKMTRTQPEYRVTKGSKTVIIKKSGAQPPDYTGYDKAGIYKAVEVKTCRGTSAPWSIVSGPQKLFLDDLTPGQAYVFIYWIDCGRYHLYSYVPTYDRVDYKRSQHRYTCGCS